MVISIFKKNQPATTLSARDLFSPLRLDLPVKYMFFRYLRDGVMSDTADKLYRQHIMARTGGQEPSDQDGTRRTAKQSMEDYIKAAEVLYWSMCDYGYDSRFPAPFGGNGLLLNAAHRLGCAAALDLDVPFEENEEDGYPWDFKWFIENGFKRNQLSLILKEYALLTADRTAVFVLWGPALRFWDELTAEIGKEFQIAGHLDFAFGLEESNGFKSLVYDVYAYNMDDHCDGMAHIDRKLGFLEEAPFFYRVVVASLSPADKGKMEKRSRSLKNRLRQSIAGHVDVNKFVSCHASETKGETRHMARTLLDPWNVAALRQRKSTKPRAEFLRWLSAFGRKLKSLQIDQEDCCIVGSSSLEVCGIRLSTDIDFTVRKQIREDLFDKKSRALGSQIDVVMEGYHRPRSGKAYTDDQLIDDPSLHFLFRGFKFASLAIVHDRKSNSIRPKDMLDVELMDQWREDHVTVPEDLT